MIRRGRHGLPVRGSVRLTEQLRELQYFWKYVSFSHTTSTRNSDLSRQQEASDKNVILGFPGRALFQALALCLPGRWSTVTLPSLGRKVRESQGGSLACPGTRLVTMSGRQEKGGRYRRGAGQPRDQSDWKPTAHTPALDHPLAKQVLPHPCPRPTHRREKMARVGEGEQKARDAGSQGS